MIVTGPRPAGSGVKELNLVAQDLTEWGVISTASRISVLCSTASCRCRASNACASCIFTPPE
ncbi:MAG: hypothetical protein ACLSHC_00540 [Bilophila wadsworthia]